MAQLKVPLFRPKFSPEDVELIADVLYSGHISTGLRCEQFENMFAEQIGINYAIATNSCTAALHLALSVAGIGHGDIVFVPTMAFASDIAVVEWQGAIPILIDCEPQTLCINPAKLLQMIERIKLGEFLKSTRPLVGKLRAVIAVDYAGQMADYSVLRKICTENNMLLIEDSSHALPAFWREGPTFPWQSSGTVADIACFSFYANKPITTGEGGMVVTNNAQWATQMKSLRLHGFENMNLYEQPGTWYRQVVQLGFKYNLTDIAAAIGIRQIQQLEVFWHARQTIARLYSNSLLSDCTYLELPKELPDRQHAWHLYVVKLKHKRIADHRNAIINELYKRGVETSVHWFPLHLHKYYRERLHFFSDLSISEETYPRLISLPIFPSMTEEELQFVVTNFTEVLNIYN